MRCVSPGPLFAAFVILLSVCACGRGEVDGPSEGEPGPGGVMSWPDTTAGPDAAPPRGRPPGPTIGGGESAESYGVRPPAEGGTPDHETIEPEPPAPPLRDSDFDGIPDQEELEAGTDPGCRDTDEDLIEDGAERLAGTDPLVRDTDGDGALDGSEIISGSDPRVPDEACAISSFEAYQTLHSIDIIFVIDQSGSMNAEIDSVVRNINVNFADIIGESLADYRVIMLAEHGSSSNRICISEPLSGTLCTPQTQKPAQTERFFHYSQRIASSDSLQKILETYRRADSLNLAPKGWSAWLRPSATKLFVEITDDNSSLRAEEFDRRLLETDPEMFGTPENRKYVFYTIAGLRGRGGSEMAWSPDEPLVSEKCTPDSVNPGVEYQKLSVLTGGLRFPVCHWASFDEIFNEIAKGVIEEVRLGCSMDLPPAPRGLEANTDRLVIEYAPGARGKVRAIQRTDDLEQCTADGFVVEDRRIRLCEQLCDEVREDLVGRMWIRASCRVACDPDAIEICEDRRDNDCDGLTDMQDDECEGYLPGKY